MSTNRKQQIVDYIRRYIEENGAFPTLENIKDGVGLKAVSTVHQHIKDLLKDGVIIDDGMSYSLATPAKDTSKEVMIIGTIAAGQPIEAIENPTESVRVTSAPTNQELYALRVQGDSMVEDGIFDGDIVVIKKQDSAENGQTVVAIIDDNRATLKKLYREKDGFRLQPANQTMLPLFRDEVEVRGVVWNVIRSFNNKEKEKSTMTKTWKTVDLFAGVGGIRLGFEANGFTTVFANDFEPKCADTYDKNFKTAKLTVEDITKIPASDIPDCDFVLGGFPCQAFSIAGYRKGFDDDKGRGNLFFEVARIIKEKQPTGFLLENVKNLRGHDGGKTFQVIQNTLEDLGYHIKAKVLNSMEYGNVPQNRERIYIVGFKDKNKIDAFEFPEPIERTVTVRSLLEKDVPEKYYYNNKPLYERLKDDVTDPDTVYQWRRQYVRANKSGVCPTLTANMGTGGHNVPIICDKKGIRKLTPKECFKIQGFPDDYELPAISDAALYKQAGNSVSVPVIKRIAEQMAKVL